MNCIPCSSPSSVVRQLSPSYSGSSSRLLIDLAECSLVLVGKTLGTELAILLVFRSRCIRSISVPFRFGFDLSSVSLVFFFFFFFFFSSISSPRKA